MVSFDRRTDDGESVFLKLNTDRVLVCSNQAIITRIAEHNLQGEKTHLRIGGLLTSQIDDSVRVRLTGTALPRMVNLEVILVHKRVFMKEELPRNSKSFCRKLGRWKTRRPGWQRRSVSSNC